MVELAALIIVLPFIIALILLSIWGLILVIAVIKVIPDFLFYWPNKLLGRS